MIKRIITFFRFIFGLFNTLFNFIMLKVNKVHYSSYIIRGRIQIRNKGNLKIG